MRKDITLEAAISRMEGHDREILMNYIRPDAQRLEYFTVADVISKATVPWNATPQGWAFWRDLHNKYSPKSHRYTGLYESDPEPTEQAVNADTYRGTPSWRYKGSRYGGA
jgi:hypothetical protein